MRPRDFSGGAVVKNPPSNAGDMGSIPGQGTRTPHAAEKLRPRISTTEPAVPQRKIPHATTKICHSLIKYLK